LWHRSVYLHLHAWLTCKKDRNSFLTIPEETRVLASSRPIFIEWEQTLKDFITVRIKSLTSQPLNVTNQQCRSLERHKAPRRPVCLEVHICSQTALHYANWQPYFSVSLYLSQKDVIVFKTVIFEGAWFFISREKSKNNFSISVLKLSNK